MRVCVLGAGGLLGHMLVRVLGDSHDVYGTTRTRWSPEAPLAHFLSKEKWLSGVDAGNIGTVEELFKNRSFDVVINCIGVVKQRLHISSDEEMMSINGEFPHSLVNIANANSTRVIHISTDCVFSGRKGNYTEQDEPDPVDIYGHSKLLGEIVDKYNLTIRTSHVGRELSHFGSFFEWVLNHRNQSIDGYPHAIYSGLTTQNLSRVIDQLLSRLKNLCGILQVASNPISKLNLICELNSRLNLGIRVGVDESVVIDRTLNSSRLTRITGISVSSWQKMLDDFCKDQSSYKFLVGSQCS